MAKFFLTIIAAAVMIPAFICTQNVRAGNIPASINKKDEYLLSDFRKITAMTAKILEKNHYSAVKMDQKFSSRIFDIYFDALDPMHIFFTQKDIASFEIYRKKLGTALQIGEFDFAFTVYDLYRKRYAQYRKFSEKMLSEKIDFSADESLHVNMDDQPRPNDKKEMFELWRKQIKNELLSFRLSSADEKSKQKKSPEKRILQRLRDVSNAIEKRDRVDILGLLLDSMAQAYGAHSDYQAPKRSEDFEIHMSLSLSGIGATLTSEDGYIKVVELVPGGPAEKSGKIKVNDRIVTVTQENGDSVDVIDMPVGKAVQYIRGEKGSKVTLDVLSGNSSVPKKVVITRDKIQLTDSAAKGEIRKVKSNNRIVKVGVIILPSFYMDFDAVMRGDANARRASTDVRAILEDFKKANVDSVVIDLRSNGGGSLPDAVTLSGLFLNGGPVVQVRTADNLEVHTDRDPSTAYDGPLVLLTSKMSASSAEIFTGALKDAKRAVVVGDSRTFGKGTVLRVESLDRYNNWFGKNKPYGSLTFEIAMFFRPAGDSVQQLGIAPDILLPSLTEEMKVGEIFLDNHLPWDSIKPLPHKPWDKNIAQKIVILRNLSTRRIAKNTVYQAFINQIKLYRTVRDRKTLTLNEQKRKEEYRKEKEIIEASEKVFSQDKNKKENAGDVVLNEAINIAADLSFLNLK